MTRTVVTWVLLGIWGALMSFAVVSQFSPPWLEKLARGGVVTEVRGYRDGGDSYMREGNFREALAWYERALRIDPDDVAARINSAIAHGKLGRPEAGLTVLREALARGPQDRGVVLYNIAELHRQMGESESAIAAYTEALAEGGAPELIHARLADLYAERGDGPRARDELRLALSFREDPAASYRRMLVSARETVGADSVQQRALEAAQAHGVTPADLERYDLDFLQRQLDRDPERGRLLGRLGVLEAQLGEREAAADHLRRALEILPGSPESATLRARLAELESGRAG